MMMRGLMMAGMVLASGAVCAVDAKGPELDYAKAEKGVYTVDGSHALVTWKVWHMGTSHYSGRFDKVTGTLKFDPAKPEESTLSVNIDPASADTTSAKLTEELVSAQFFDAAKYPAITFKSTKVVLGKKLADGKQAGKVTGDVSFHGVTKPVVLDVVFNGSQAHPMMGKQMLGFSATTTLRRSEFGVNYGIPMVGDEVRLELEVEFHKQD
jgi:polyisoprenoid-binding protein YceI